MNGKVEASLKQLSSLSKSLNEASDQLSKQISAIEVALNEYKLGVWVWAKKPILTETEISDPDEQGRRFEYNFDHQLGYGKHKGKWGLLVSSGWEGDDGMDTKITPLRDAPREIRIKAMDRIPDLMDDLAQEMLSVTQEASKRAAEAKQLAAALNNKKSR